jgi:hypothetical protein
VLCGRVVDEARVSLSRGGCDPETAVNCETPAPEDPTDLDPPSLFLGQHTLQHHLSLDRDASEALKTKPDVTAKRALRLHTLDDERRLQANAKFARFICPCC